MIEEQTYTQTNKHVPFIVIDVVGLFGGGTSNRTAPATQNAIAPPLYIGHLIFHFAAHALEKRLLLLRNAFVELECRMQNRIAVIGLDLPAVNCVHRCVTGNAVHDLEAPSLV